MGDILKIYVLGILSHLNDVLQDRKPAEKKQQVLRGLGRLIEQIGPSITNVAPQVGLSILNKHFEMPIKCNISRSWQRYRRHFLILN